MGVCGREGHKGSDICGNLLGYSQLILMYVSIRTKLTRTEKKKKNRTRRGRQYNAEYCGVVEREKGLSLTIVFLNWDISVFSHSCKIMH